MKIFVITPNVNVIEVERRFGKNITELTEAECYTLADEGEDVQTYLTLAEFERHFNGGDVSDEGFIRIFSNKKG